MKKIFKRLLPSLCAAALLLQLSPAAALCQQQNRPQPQTEPQGQADDVVRITTELVQTDVSVFDKQGRFIDGLKKEDFELKIDGRPVEVNFFDRVMAGTLDEEAQLAAARGAAPRVASATAAKDNKGTGVVAPLDRGRVVAFLIDDLHMAFDSLKRAKETVTNFIDKEMGQNDLMAVVSSSGQIGFLQQFTDNREVLRRAVARLNYKKFEARDVQRPPMSSYQALMIDRGDRDVSDFFVDETLRQNPGTTREMALSMVNDRATTILQQLARSAVISMQTLENLTRSSAQMPGRKLVFLISDGFFLDTRNSDTLEKTRRITDAAARSGVVIYSMDAKGLVTGMPDAGTEAAFDPSGRLQRAAGGELAAAQDVMNAIASDSGGRFIKNTNQLETGLVSALKETSVYYLLAWRPDAERERAGKFRRIEVGIRNRPELVVRVQRGFFETKPEQKAKEGNNNNARALKTPEDYLRKAISGPAPQKGLPTQLALSFIDVPDSGLVLLATMKVEGTNVVFERAGGKPTAVIDVAGAIIDAQGKQMSGFRERLTATQNDAGAAKARLPDVTYNYRSPLKPGLYQVRVAARDDKSGQTGSATQWVEIPDLSKQVLSMSSLIVGERKPDASQEEKREETLIEGVPFSVDRRFERTSRLRFLVYIYNATRGTNASAQPDVALQVQVFRDNQPVVTTPLRKVSTESQDLARLAYAAEIPLQAMTAGQYVLQVTAIDRIAKTSTSQRVKFEIQ
jgi:VWFA-related protein